MTPEGCTPWWQRDDVLSRWVRDLLAAEMAALRPGGWPWPHDASPRDVHLVEDLGADSLEMMGLSAAFADALDLQCPQRLDALYRQPTWQGWTTVAREQWAQCDARLRFASSGSTGRPQRSVHQRVELEQEVDAVLDAALGAHIDAPMDTMPGDPGQAAPTRIITAVRAHHIYGFLFSALLPQRLLHRRLQAVEVLDMVGRPPALAVHMVRSGDLVLGFPDWWRVALRSGDSWPAGVVGLTSTAPCPADIGQQALAAGIGHWIEIYGSTETAGIGWRHTPGAPFVLHAHWQRADDDSLIRRRPDGTVSSPLQPPDRLEWTDDRHFLPLARRDGVVQVGGVNVDPAAVRSQLLKHPGVADAAVRTTEVGSGLRLKAFVVPHAPAPEPHRLAQDITDWCRRHLAPAARPVEIRVGSELPRNEMGKPRDW